MNLNFFLKDLNFFSNLCVGLCKWISHVCGYLQRPEKGVGSPGTGVSGSLQLPDVGAGNRTSVLWESSKCSQSLSCLSSHWLWISDPPFSTSKTPGLQACATRSFMECWGSNSGLYILGKHSANWVTPPSLLLFKTGPGWLLIPGPISSASQLPGFQACTTTPSKIWQGYQVLGASRV